METFRQLYVYSNEISVLRHTLLKIRQHLPETWKLRDDVVQRYIKTVNKSTEDFLCIESPLIFVNDKKVQGLVWLGRWENKLELMNIVPPQSGSLSYTEYNTILLEFYEKLLIPNLQNSQAEIFLSGDAFNLNDIAGADTAEKLRYFSDFANKVTGNSHPADLKRWCEFVISAHRNNNSLTSDKLLRWLKEEGNWPDDEVLYNLVYDYEYGLDLLSLYDNDN